MTAATWNVSSNADLGGGTIKLLTSGSTPSALELHGYTTWSNTDFTGNWNAGDLDQVEFLGSSGVTGTTALIAQVNILNAGTMDITGAGLNGVHGGVDDGAFTTKSGGKTVIGSGGTVTFQNYYETVASGGEMDVMDGTTIKLDYSQGVSGTLYVDGTSAFRTAKSLNLNDSGAWLKLDGGSAVTVNMGNVGGTLDVVHGNIVLQNASADNSTATINGNVTMDNSDSKIIVGYNNSTVSTADYTATLIVSGNVTETHGEIDILIEGWMAMGIGGGGGNVYADAQLAVSGTLTASGAILVSYSGLPNPAHNRQFEVVTFFSKVGTWAGGVTLPDTTNWTGDFALTCYLVTYTGT